MVRFQDLLFFDGPAYKHKLDVFATEKKFHEILEREVIKTRQVWGAGTKIGMGIILLLPTMGLTTISSIVGMRQLWVACSKLKVITDIIKKYDITPHECSLRDAVIPIVINVLTAGIGFGTSLGLSEIAMMGVDEAAAQGVTPAEHSGLEATASSAAANPVEFAEGFMHGVETQVDTVQAAILQPGDAASNAAQVNVEDAVLVGNGGGGGAYMDGANLGATAAPAAKRFMLQTLISTFLETMTDAHAKDCLGKVVVEEGLTEELRGSGKIYEWQKEMEQAGEAIHKQFLNLTKAHLVLTGLTQARHSAIAQNSKAIYKEMARRDDATRDLGVAAETARTAPSKKWNAGTWFKALQNWNKALKYQANSQAGWQITIDEWKELLTTTSSKVPSVPSLARAATTHIARRCVSMSQDYRFCVKE